MSVVKTSGSPAKTGADRVTEPGVLPSGQVRAVLFDMDNTLFDFVAAQVAACSAVVRLLDEPDEDSLYPYFVNSVHGYESHENIRDFLRDRGISGPEAYEAGRRIYEQEKIRFIVPYPGAADTLAQIQEQGITMGIITDAHSRDATRRLEKTGLLPFFSGMISYDMVRVKKPAPEPFLAALEMFRSTADEVLLVGDSPQRDIEPGRSLGIRTVYARYGDRFSYGRSPVRCDYTIDSIAELPSIITSLSGKKRIGIREPLQFVPCMSEALEADERKQVTRVRRDRNLKEQRDKNT